MPHFEVIVRNGGDVVDGGGAIDALDVKSACAQAIILAKEILAQCIQHDAPIANLTFDVTKAGFLMRSISSSEVLGLKS